MCLCGLLWAGLIVKSDCSREEGPAIALLHTAQTEQLVSNRLLPKELCMGWGVFSSRERIYLCQHPLISHLPYRIMFPNNINSKQAVLTVWNYIWMNVSVFQSWVSAQPPSSWAGTGEPTLCLRRARKATWRGSASRSCATKRRPGRSLKTSQRRWDKWSRWLGGRQPETQKV